MSTYFKRVVPDDAIPADVLEGHLQGDALTEWQSTRQQAMGEEDERWSVEECLEILYKRWQRQDAEEHYDTQLRQCKQSLDSLRGVLDYNTRFQRIALMCRGTLKEPRIIERYLEGLKLAEIKASLSLAYDKEREHTGLASLMSWAESGTRRLKPQVDYGQQKEQPWKQKHTVAAVKETKAKQPKEQAEVAALDPAVVKPGHKQHKGGSTKKKLTATEKAWLREHNGCFKCRHLGHQARDCEWQPPEKGQGDSSEN
jgi:hypothetical protein